MKVTARFYGYVKEAAGTGGAEFDLPDGGVLQDLVDLLESQGAAIGQLLRADERELVPVAVVVDGRVCPKSEWPRTALHERALVQILPPTVGGSGRGPGQDSGPILWRDALSVSYLTSNHPDAPTLEGAARKEPRGQSNRESSLI